MEDPGGDGEDAEKGIAEREGIEGPLQGQRERNRGGAVRGGFGLPDVQAEQGLARGGAENREAGGLGEQEQRERGELDGGIEEEFVEADVEGFEREGGNEVPEGEVVGACPEPAPRARGFGRGGMRRLRSLATAMAGVR